MNWSKFLRPLHRADKCWWLRYHWSGLASSAAHFHSQKQCICIHIKKAEEPEIKLPPSAGSLKKQESSKETSISTLLTMPKPLTVWITINCGKFWKGWKYQTIWPAAWETCMQVRKQQLELDMEQQTGSKYEKEYVKAVYCHHAYLTYMQNTSWEMLGWMKHKLESR